MFKYSFLIIVIISLFFEVNSNDYYKALDLFNNKKVEESIIKFKKVASDENNDKRSDAMFNIALIYDNGFGIRADKTKALYYYEAAAELSNKFALFNLGWMYFNGENVNKNVVKAYDLYKLASDFGHPRAMYNIANMYYKGVGTVKDLKMAYKMFLKSRLNGIKESEFFIKEITNVLTIEELNLLNKEFDSLIEKKSFFQFLLWKSSLIK